MCFMSNFVVVAYQLTYAHIYIHSYDTAPQYGWDNAAAGVNVLLANITQEQASKQPPFIWMIEPYSAFVG